MKLTEFTRSSLESIKVPSRSKRKARTEEKFAIGILFHCNTRPARNSHAGAAMGERVGKNRAGLSQIKRQFLMGIENGPGHFFQRRGFRVLGLPTHGSGDAGTPARVIEEDNLLKRRRVHFTIF